MGKLEKNKKLCIYNNRGNCELFYFLDRIREKEQFFQNWDLKRRNNKFISLAFHFKPDICLFAGGHQILPKTIEKKVSLQ